MKEYIEREAALAICEQEYQERLKQADWCGDTVAWNIGGAIKGLPAADVAPVVRCRECRHSSLPSGFTQRYGEPGTLSCHFGPCNRRNVNENDFCSYGQRKEDEQ